MTNQFELYLDIETMDTVHTAKVWEIGAVVINPDKKLTSFSCLINWKEYERLDYFTESQDTLAWIESKASVYNRWMEAKNEGLEICDAFNELEIFLDNELGDARLQRENLVAFSWGGFDFPITNHAMEQFGFSRVCHYGSECDLRSVTKFLKSDIRPDTSEHIALCDALALVKAVEELRASMPLIKG